MFIGFELAAALGEESKDPQRSIPKAVVATILIVGAFYLITQYTLAVGATETASDFVPMADVYLNRFFAVWIDLAILLDILAVGIGFQLAAARGLFTLSRDGLLPAPLARLNSRLLPANASLVVLAVTVITTIVALTKYGTDLVDPAGPVAFFNTEVFNGFLIASRIGGFLICIVYVLLCVGALRKFATNRVVDLVAAVIGLATVVLAIYSQFWDETAPRGSELWGRHLSLILVAVALIWAFARKRECNRRRRSAHRASREVGSESVDRTGANDHRLLLASPAMGNRRVRVMWCDLNGLSHGRYVPRAGCSEHGHHAVTTLTMGIDRDILPVDGYAADVGFPDLSTVPLPNSVRPGWEVDTDVVIADLEFNGEPLALGPRNALQARGRRLARARLRADARVRDGVLRHATRRRCAGWLRSARHPVAPRLRRGARRRQHRPDVRHVRRCRAQRARPRRRSWASSTPVRWSST